MPPTINVDFDIYLPSVNTYFNYLELLKAHRFIPQNQEWESIIKSMMEELNKDIGDPEPEPISEQKE